LPQQTSALVKRAAAYLHQDHARPLARREIAETLGVRKDDLSRVFRNIAGVSPQAFRAGQPT
jgi:transcriptional regulator GlxA family with amidase domain